MLSLRILAIIGTAILLSQNSISSENSCRSLFGKGTAVPAVEINDLASFNHALTRGMLLGPGQTDLFEVYLKTAFGDPKISVGKTLVDVLKLIDENPGLYKPHFAEVVIEPMRRIYKSPEMLNKFIKSSSGTVGQIKSNWFQIEANIGFWKKMIGYTDPELPSGLSKDDLKEQKALLQQRFLAFLEPIISATSRKFLADPYTEHRPKVIALFKTLEHVRQRIEEQGRDSLPIRQAMVDVVASAGFFNSSTQILLKSKNGLDRIEALSKIFDERDSIAIELGYSGHFLELMNSLQIPFPSFSGKVENVSEILARFTRYVVDLPYVEVKGDPVRIRSLSIHEAAFRSCIGGSDCSSRTYFSRALDPNYYYFTRTDLNHHSSGHITVVLGTAKNPKTQKEHKVAFIDKIQNVANEDLPGMLEAVRQSVLEKGYLLGIPEDLGDHNGISNMEATTELVKEKIIPAHSGRLLDFTPHTHDYNFPNSYSRAEDHLSLRIIGGRTFTDGTRILRGQSYEANTAPASLTAKTVAQPILALREFKNLEDKNKYVDSSTMILTFEKLGLIPIGTYFDDLNKIVKSKDDPFPLRRKAFLQKCLLFGRLESELLNEFSAAERSQIQSEMGQWKKSSDPRKVAFFWSLFEVFEGEMTLENAKWLANLGSMTEYWKKAFFNEHFKKALMILRISDMVGSESAGLSSDKNKVDINAQANLGYTAIMIAVENWSRSGAEELANELLKRQELDLSASNHLNRITLDYATRTKDLKLVKAIFKGTVLPEATRKAELERFFLRAVAVGSDEIRDFYLGKIGGFSTELANRAFSEAVLMGKFDLAISLATENKIDVNLILNDEDKTPLTFALMRWRSPEARRFVEYLLQRVDIDLDRRDSRGRSALDHARSRNERDLVELLETSLAR